MNVAQKKRVFWLGMHKVLVHTELTRLRELGYEVFNPPYLSDVFDQSAIYDWSAPPTTLPQEAIHILSRTNFFYDKIGPEAAEILNTFFDAVIVTINPQWLVNVLEVFRGKIIYRTYGQPYSLSDYLTSNGAFGLITERENFWFSPHSAKVLDLEDRWLLERSKIVPYCLTDDVVSLRDTWSGNQTEPLTALLCPRASDNPYYGEQYRILKAHFSADSARVFGAQKVPLQDSWAIGTLDRSEFLRKLTSMRGFAYHYSDSHVCYLPPIEYMTLGGPVAFLKGSLLSKYFTQPTPGRASDLDDLVKIAERLRQDDSTLRDEVIDAQSAVRQLYQPDHVWPIFDVAMQEMLGERGTNQALKAAFTPRLEVPTNDRRAEAVLVPFHGFGPMIVREGGEYHCAEGIARVTRQVVRALTDAGLKVVVTANQNDVGRVHGFFAESLGGALCKLQVMTADAIEWQPRPNAIARFNNRLWKTAKTQPFSAYIERIRFYLRSRQFAALPRAGLVTLAIGSAKALMRLERGLRGRGIRLAIESKPYMDLANGSEEIEHIFVPHYYMFPEVVSARGKNVVLYLPDYMPHFYKSSAEMGAGAETARIGKLISGLADRVLTNSLFTKSYLPQTALAVPDNKIAHVPLPYLSRSSDLDASAAAEGATLDLPAKYVFYPTRNRPSKRLRDFVETVKLVNRRLQAKGDGAAPVYGVLTTELPPNLVDEEVRPFIVVFPSLTDSALTEVYRRATCLLFTSEMEGNFPTQVTEALHLGIPIVATKISLITLELGDAASSLDLVDVGDCSSFADRVVTILENRQAVLDLQGEARSFALVNFSYDRFRDELLKLFPRKSRAHAVPTMSSSELGTIRNQAPWAK